MIRHATWMTPFLVLALLLQTLLPFYAVYSVAPTTTAAEFAAIYGETVILCTPDGFKRVSWEDVANHKAPEHPRYECAVCYMSAHGNAIGSNCTASAAPVAMHGAAIASAAPRAPRDEAGRLSHPRAPPAVIVTA